MLNARELDEIYLEAEAMFDEILSEFQADLMGSRSDYMGLLDSLATEEEDATEAEPIEGLQLQDQYY